MRTDARSRVRRAAVAMLLILLVAPLAGCLGSDAPADSAGSADARPTGISGPFAVVAFLDGGINPYHADFRDESARAFEHPSTYLPDYPADALPLNLTFDHAALDEAVAADCQAWSQVGPDTLYWVPGTRIVGLMMAEEGPSYACDEESDDWPWFMARGDASHGTMVASRGAGEAYGACSECLIVAVQRHGFAAQAGPAVRWTADQPWIDIQSNSWGPDQRPCPDGFAGCATPAFAQAVEDAAARQPSFWGTGNSLEAPGAVGDIGVGHPSQMDPRLTPSAIRVAGHDNGDVILWTGSSPHVASDACRAWQALHETMDERAPDAWGGSAAVPYAAGIAGQLLLEARSILGDDRTGVRDGVLVEGDADRVDAGPLADGAFTIDELKGVLYATADPRPDGIEADGDACHFGTHNRRGLWTLPVAWGDVPEGPAGVAIIGYGAVTPGTTEGAFQVLRGESPMPDRSAEDAFFEADRTYREAFHEGYTNVLTQSSEGLP